MKKFIIALSILGILLSPVSVKAATDVELQISLLTKQIEVLQQLVQLLLSQQNMAKEENVSGYIIPEAVQKTSNNPEAVPTCTLVITKNNNSEKEYQSVTVSWETKGIPEGTVGTLYIPTRWIQGEPDFNSSLGVDILKAPSGTYNGNVEYSHDYKATFGKTSCYAKI